MGSVCASQSGFFFAWEAKLGEDLNVGSTKEEGVDPS